LRRRFRVEVGTLMVGILLAQAVALMSLAYWGAHELLYAVGRAAHEEEHTRLETEIRAFVGSATGAVQALAASPAQGYSAGAEKRAAELIWALMSQSDALDNLYFAHHDGSVIGMQRYPVAAVRRIHPGSGSATEVLEFKPALEQRPGSPRDRYATSRTERRSSAYDARRQAWFVAALHSGQPHWTAVHSLPFSGEPGVTFAAPDALLDEKGGLDGVAAGDISLRHLDRLVRTFSHAGLGESAILAGGDRVLARSDREPGGGEPTPPATDDILHAALAAVAHPSSAAQLAFGGQVFLVRTSAIPGTPWRLVSWLPEEAVIGGLRLGLQLSAVVLAVCLAAAVLVSLWLARRISHPVEILAGVARRIGRLELEGLARVQSSIDEIHRLDEALDDSARSLRVLRKFVPADTVDVLIRGGRALEPGGEQLELTAMFTDVAGFTAIAADVPPERLVPQLTEYFNLATAVMVRHGGTIDKYMGDGMMILWGAPRPLEAAAYRACLAALELQRLLDDLNDRWVARGLRPLRTRVGLHTGVAVAGVLGSTERLTFTAYGDTINIASRIEAANKELGTRILLSRATAEALGGRLPLRACGELELRGRRGRWPLYELVESGGAAPEPGR
jgi:adenylate cyclase